MECLEENIPEAGSENVMNDETDNQVPAVIDTSEANDIAMDTGKVDASESVVGLEAVEVISKTETDKDETAMSAEAELPESGEPVPSEPSNTEPVPFESSLQDGGRELIGIDDEMEAMFGESLPKEGEHDAKEVQSLPSDIADTQDTRKDEDSEVKSAESHDESNLEVLMEQMHADKMVSPRSKPKDPGMELQDVLQALTEDDPAELGSSDNKKVSPKKPSEAADSNNESEALRKRTTRSSGVSESEVTKDAVSEGSSESDGEQEEKSKMTIKKRSGSSNQDSNPKTKSSKEEDGSDCEAEKPDTKKEEVVKRGRGRPRKYPVTPGKESNTRDNAKTDDDKSKQKKTVVTKKADDGDLSDKYEKPIQVKRGPGRPRKRPLPDDEEKDKPATKKKSDDESMGSSDDEPAQKTPRPRQRRKSDDSSGNETIQKGISSSKRGTPATRNKSEEQDKLMSKSNKVCVLLDCRQHCLPSLGISLHRFPMANNPMRKHWLTLINMDPPGPTTAYMCSKHFEDQDYTYDESKSPSDTFYRKLKPLAFPSLGLPVSDEVIDDVRSKVEDIRSGKDHKEVMRGFLKEVRKKGKDEEESSRSLKGNSDAAEGSARRKTTGKTDSRSPSPKSSEVRTPGTNCSVPSCGNNLFETRAEGLNISYYRFPFDDALAARWIKKIGDPDLVARTARICSDHFLDKDFEGTLGGKRNLKPKAVPSQYLSERKPRSRGQGYEEASADEESEEEAPKYSKRRGRQPDSDEEAPKQVKGKAKSESARKPKKPKPDTSAIPMPLPIIEEIDIKSEPASDNEAVGQEYAPQDPGSDEDTEKDGKNGEEGVKMEEDELTGSGKVKPKKTLSFASLSLPIINVERLGQRVIDAAESGSLRVRIKESAEAKSRLPSKPQPKLKRKLPEPDDSPPKVRTRPGPLCKKKDLVIKPVKPRWTRKVLRTSDVESSESDIDDPPQVERIASTSFAKSPNPVKVKLAELPSFLREKVGKGSVAVDITSEELDAIMNSDKCEKEKIIKLVEQRISEHTKIIEGKSMGAQDLADHTKILQGSALVLKKLAEKSGKPLTSSQVISLNVPDSSAPGRTIVLKKVPDMKPPRRTASPGSPVKPPTAIVTPQSSPARAFKTSMDDALSDDSKHSSVDKIRDYDNLMKKYLSAVLDKNVMSKKYTESKEAQKQLECKLAEKIKECDNMKRKAAALNAKMNRVNTALEYFLTPNQIKLALQETKKVAWSPEEMLTAFTIKHLSKACYLFLRHKLNYPLPGISSLQRWMKMLSKDKTGDDEDDTIADEDLSDKEEGQDIIVEEPGVVHEISGTLEEINAGGNPGEDDEFVTEENLHQMKDSNRNSPIKVMFENEGDRNSNRKVIVLKKVTNTGGQLKSKIHISASKNNVNVSGMDEGDDKNELYKLLPPGTKTISMSMTTPAGSQQRKVMFTKKNQEKEKITFQRLPQMRKAVQKPPTIHIVKNEPSEVLHELTEAEGGVETIHMDVSDIGDNEETIVKPEDVSHHPSGQLLEDGTEQKYFTISDLDSSQMEEHVVENVEHSMDESHSAQHLVQQGEGHQQTEMICDDSGQVSRRVVHQGASGLEELVQLATSGEQQITFATTEDLAQAGQYVTYQGPQGEITYAQGPQGEITLSEDMNNMTAVVINDIDEDQLNMLMSNVVEGKSEQSGQFGQKKIVYQTIDNQKNVIVLQPDSQAFIEEDEGTNSGTPRVYIINDEGHIVSSGGNMKLPRNREPTRVGPHHPNLPGPSQPSNDIGFIDSSSFAELGLKLAEPETFSIGNLIRNYAINSPTRPRT